VTGRGEKHSAYSLATNSCRLRRKFSFQVPEGQLPDNAEAIGV
jgi:hypothetical protein